MARRRWLSLRELASAPATATVASAWGAGAALPFLPRAVVPSATMSLAAASAVGFVIGYGWFLTGGAECDRADCGWLAELFYETWFVGFVLLIAAGCGLIVAAIRGMVRWHRLRR